MTQTKLDTSGLAIVFFMVLLIAGIIIYITFEALTGNLDLSVGLNFVLTGIAFILGPLYILVELPKLCSLSFDSNKLKIKSLLTKRKKVFSIDQLDGFRTLLQTTYKGGQMQEIIIVKDGKPVQVISSNYITNFEEIGKQLGKRVENLGIEKFELLKYLKDRLIN